MNNCILCFKEHNQIFEGQPHIYCGSCSEVKKASTAVVSEILPNLFLSSMVAAGTFEGDRLYVHEFPKTYAGDCIHIPILTKRPNSKADRTGAIASIDALDKAADIIDEHIYNNERLLVHCYGGVERSPLTIAWWLLRTHQYKTFDEAYAFLQSKRPVVSPRVFWLPNT